MTSPSADFSLLVQQLRSGDRNAISGFVSEYEPYLRRMIRIRLSKSSMHAVADSVDICQSVLGSFLIRLAAGEYELTSRPALEKLLHAIASKKFLALQRRELALKRDRRNTVSIHSVADLVDASQSQPVQSAINQDLLTEFERRLCEDERNLYLMRRDQRTWAEISLELCEDATVLRKRLSRAIRRVSIELGIEYEST